MTLSILFFIMVGIQSAAYLWFQSKGGVVTHKTFVIVNLFLMTGQSAQSIESFIKEAYASFAVATFFFFVSLVGIIRRLSIAKKEGKEVKIEE